MRRLAVLVCSFGYIGFFPIAPGTVGSAAGLVVYVIGRRVGLAHFELPLIGALFAVGVLAGGAAERELGSIDPGPIVIDEVMGMLMTLFRIPVGWVGLILGFLLFRVFDIVKPFPARRFERLPGGLGVMADDAMAAVYANLLLHGAYYLFPHVISNVVS
jgi:phosphatidylglycerophosphatase A